jgi:hypothetical protein
LALTWHARLAGDGLGTVGKRGWVGRLPGPAFAGSAGVRVLGDVAVGGLASVRVWGRRVVPWSCRLGSRSQSTPPGLARARAFTKGFDDDDGGGRDGGGGKVVWWEERCGGGKNDLPTPLGKLTRWAAQNSKFNRWGLCTLIHCQLLSVGVRWTSVGLSVIVRLFPVDFDCWFGDIPADSPLDFRRTFRRCPVVSGGL